MPTPRPPGRLIWLHAASVGETMSILPVLPALAEAAPTILLTTGTVTSARLLAQRLDPALAGRVLHRFAPLDVPRWAARFLDHWRPDAAGFVESELWPNLLAACRGAAHPDDADQCPAVRAQPARGGGACRGWRVTCWAGSRACSRAARPTPRRLRALGCCRVGEPGDLKLAAPPLPADETELRRLRELLAGRPVWLAASTHPGEETLVLAAHRTLAADHPGLLTIIAPRHPERGADHPRGGLPFARRRSARRRASGSPTRWASWGCWYRLAGIAFIGRSLLPPGGGQNPLEPARLGCAIAVGPHTGNFADHVAMLRDAGGLTVVRDATELARWVDGLLRDPARRQAMGQAAVAAVQRHGDLPRRTAAALIELLG